MSGDMRGNISSDSDQEGTDSEDVEDTGGTSSRGIPEAHRGPRGTTRNAPQGHARGSSLSSMRKSPIEDVLSEEKVNYRIALNPEIFFRVQCLQGEGHVPGEKVRRYIE